MEQGIAFLLSSLIANGKSSYSDAFPLSSLIANGKSSYSDAFPLSSLIANGKSSYSDAITLSALIANKPNGQILGLMITDRGKAGAGVMTTNTSKPISVPSSGQIYPRIINI